MKKPIKDVVIDFTNAAIRGYTKLTFIPMMIAESQHRRKQGIEAVQKTFDDALDLQAQMTAVRMIKDRLDAGVYDGCTDEEIFADFLQLRAFEKIAIRIK